MGSRGSTEYSHGPSTGEVLSGLITTDRDDKRQDGTYPWVPFPNCDGAKDEDAYQNEILPCHGLRIIGMSKSN